MEPGKHDHEVASGERFRFGRNWRSFLDTIDEDRIREAKRSLLQMLEMDDFDGRTFLDVGSGSGLFSLAAHQLGARVHSFDYDPQSVDCTRELRRRHAPGKPGWIIDEGSILDRDFVTRLGMFDLVYAWGVLHHTGALWSALRNTCSLVRRGGTLFLAIYNDQGRISDVWKVVKKLYCSSAPARVFLVSLFFPLFTFAGMFRDFPRVRSPLTLHRDYKRSRGMSCVHDCIDWLGGYPFEVSSPESVVDFCRQHGFSLRKMRTAGRRLGNNQFVFTRSSGRKY